MTQNWYGLVSEKRVPSISMECIVHYSYLLYNIYYILGLCIYIYTLSSFPGTSFNFCVIPVNIVQFLGYTMMYPTPSRIHVDHHRTVEPGPGSSLGAARASPASRPAMGDGRRGGDGNHKDGEVPG